MKRFITICILVSAGLNIWQMDRIRDLEEKKPMIIYKADNQGAEIFGKVVEKGGDMASYTRLRFVTTECSWLLRTCIRRLELGMR